MNQPLFVLADFARLLDQEQLIGFKEKPYTEKVGGSYLVHYDLDLQKQSVVPFYKALLSETQTNPDMALIAPYVNQDTLAYLEATLKLLPITTLTAV